jgi:hypothetical protein
MTGKRSYESMSCPLPSSSDPDARCTGELYVHTTESFPVYVDPEVDDFRPGKGTTSLWEVVCTEGHVVLLPPDIHCEYAEFGQPCELCPEEGIKHDDFRSLAALQERFGR